MSKDMCHPEPEQLLRYADGELTPRQAREMRSHLQACWQCRTEMEEMQRVVGECVRYRHLLAEHLPPPPAQWRDLRVGFEEIDRGLARESRQAKWRQAKMWLPVAAMLVVACAVYYELRHAPAVQASELLRKAVAAADAAPAQTHPIRIRSKRGTVVRDGKSASGKARADSLAAEFQAAHFDYDDPLSARAFSAWRAQLPVKHDEVTVTADRYQIRTASPAGELAEATLQLRSSDLHPVEERLEFRNQDWIEIEELSAGAIAPPALVAAEKSGGPAAGGAPAASVAATNSTEFRRPAPAATVGDELQVLVALHNLGADLGEHVEVKREGGQVLVAGLGIDPERQQQIQQALAANPHVVVKFSDPGDATAPAEKPVRTETPAGSGAAGLQAALEKQLGGRANYERLSGDILDLSDRMMSRAYAVHRLAEELPPQADAEMTDADRGVLRDLYRGHAAALAQDAGALERLLKPVLGPLGGRAEAPQAASSGSLQSDAGTLFRTARRVETLLAVMLGVVPGETGDLPAQVLSGLAQLRANAEAYGPGRLEAPNQR